jgi:E3 ubiquitin-protein ligase UBR2
MSNQSTDTEPFNFICLICGEMFIKPASILNQTKFKILNRLVGECTAHTYRCGTNIGVFLKIDECKIILIQLKFLLKNQSFECRGCTISAPYIDSYGETDQNFLYFIFFFKFKDLIILFNLILRK